MTHRSSWKAFLRLSLVWVPVKAYPAAVSGDHPAGGARRPQFHQLHADCGCRIRYQKQCPRHGEVAPEAIVSGYQYARDQYVVIDPAELDKLHSEDDRAITISEFVPAEALDPIYAGGKSYYLLPDGPAGHRPYAVLCRAMQQAGRHALARAVLRGRAQLLLLRPLEGLLIVSNLAYDHQIVRPSAFADQLPAVKVEAEELALARSPGRGGHFRDVRLFRLSGQVGRATWPADRGQAGRDRAGRRPAGFGTTLGRQPDRRPARKRGPAVPTDAVQETGQRPAPPKVGSPTRGCQPAAEVLVKLENRDGCLRRRNTTDLACLCGPHAGPKGRPF